MNATERILVALRDNPQGLFGNEVSRIASVSKGIVYTLLEQLVDAGDVREEMIGKRTKHFLSISGRRKADAIPADPYHMADRLVPG